MELSEKGDYINMLAIKHSHRPPDGPLELEFGVHLKFRSVHVTFPTCARLFSQSLFIHFDLVVTAHLIQIPLPVFFMIAN